MQDKIKDNMSSGYVDTLNPCPTPQIIFNNPISESFTPSIFIEPIEKGINSY
jgi:hypothetical protein